MSNDAIKNAIETYLSKSNEINKEFYATLFSETQQLGSLRKDVDDGLLGLKRQIIASNLHLIVDRIFKGENEEVIKMLTNTRNRTLFYDFTEEFNKFLILFEQYSSNLEFTSPDLGELKETFALKDSQLIDIIKEINLDNK